MGARYTTQLLKVVDKWSEILDQGGAIDVVYLDFAKAFDTVPHQRLLVNLEGYGIKGQILEWIRQFLMGRRQRVGVTETYSDWRDVLSGVPQRSVLGPALFVCFINDLPEAIASFIFLHADDTKIFRRVDSDADRQMLQRDLDRLGNWSKLWQLGFSIEKCKTMYLGGLRNRKAAYEMQRSDNKHEWCYRK